MRVWVSKFTGAVLASSLAAAAGLAAGILALRLLPPEQAGRFTLITSMAGMFGIIGVFGQSNLINRVYASHATKYHWPRDLASSLLISTLIILATLAAALLFFQLAPFEIAFVGGFSFLTVLVQVSAAMLNSYRHYVWSALLLRLSNALMILPLGMAAYGLLKPTANSLLGFQLLIALACGVLGVSAVRYYLPPAAGLPSIPIGDRRESIGLAILVFTHLLLDPGLIVVAGYGLASEAIAGFGAYFNLFGPFLLVWSILTQTIGVEFGRNRFFPRKNILLIVWGALLPVILLAWALLPRLASVLYKGRYDAFSGLALPVGMMGGLLLTEAVPRGFISVLAPARVLRQYIGIQAVFAIAMAGLELLLVSRLGAIGIAWAGVAMLTGRNLIAYATFSHLNDQRAAPA